MKDKTTASTVFAIISIAAAMFVIGLQVGKYLTCEEIYSSHGRPDVTYKNGVLLWHPWQIVPSSEIGRHRSDP